MLIVDGRFTHHIMICIGDCLAAFMMWIVDRWFTCHIMNTLKGTLTQNILAFFIIFNNKSVFFQCTLTVFKFFLLPGHFNILILNFNTHLAKCFIICSSFTEHNKKSFKCVYWTRLNIANVISEHACVLYACSLNMLGNSNNSYHFQACSGNKCKIAWACLENILKRVQWISCKLWSVLPDEDKNLEFKY